jgi:phosphatidylserine decarboxylase
MMDADRRGRTGVEPRSGGLTGAVSSLYVAGQHLLPQHALSRVVQGLTRLPAGPLTTLAIRAFVRAFRVDLSISAQPDPARFRTFNDFFTRELRDGARTPASDSNALLSPVDGVVSQLGSVDDGRILQAKGQRFDVASLLGDEALAEEFPRGLFATLYLSPRDYHRVHMPLDGELRHCSHIPGRLFSVNALTAARVPRLYARNERVVCVFDTRLGPMAVVMVGAIFVGGIELSWHGAVTPPRARRRTTLPLPKPALMLPKNRELGRFNMGSTVVVLLPNGVAEWRKDLGVGSTVRVGEAIGRSL